MYRVHALYAQDLPRPIAAHAAGALRTVTARRLSEQLQGIGVPAFAGTIESWFDDIAAAQVCAERMRAGSHPAAVLLTREFPLFETKGFASATSVKGKFLFRRKSGMSVADFQSYWRDRHGPIVGRTPELLRYVQSHMLPQSYRDASPAYDGITELYWRDYAAAVRSMSSPEMTVEQSRDAANFAAPGSVEVLLVSEEEVIR